MRRAVSRLAARPPGGLGLDAAAQHLTLAVRRGMQTKWQAPVTAEGDSPPSVKGGGWVGAAAAGQRAAPAGAGADPEARPTPVGSL